MKLGGQKIEPYLLHGPLMLFTYIRLHSGLWATLCFTGSRVTKLVQIIWFLQKFYQLGLCFPTKIVEPFPNSANCLFLAFTSSFSSFASIVVLLAPRFMTESPFSLCFKVFELKKIIFYIDHLGLPHISLLKNLHQRVKVPTTCTNYLGKYYLDQPKMVELSFKWFWTKL